MKRLSLLVLGFLAFPSLLVADIITLRDGTKLEGDIKRAGDSYLVTDSAGKVTTVPVEKVSGIQVHPQSSGDAVLSRLQSLRRAAENLSDIKQIIDRYHTFIDQNPGAPATAMAQKEMEMWIDRQEHGLVKVGDRWMTPQGRDGLRAKSTDIAIQLHDMLKQGRLKESAPIMDRSLTVDPQNPSLQYLHGVMAYQQEFLPIARKAFESVIAIAPDHAPTLNNLAVILWRQHATVPALGYYDRAMLAAPVTRQILDNVAEALNALPKDLHENAMTKKVVRHFKEQDDALQKKMNEQGLYRWGAAWVNEKDLKKLKDDEKAITDEINKMQLDFNSVKKRIAELDRHISELVNEMNLLEAQTYATGAGGQPVRLPYPPVYFTLGNQVAALKNERAARVNDLENLQKSAKAARQQLPAPKYVGMQKIIDADGLPLPAGVQLPPPPAPPTPPATQPAAPATQPAPANAKAP